MAKDLFPSPHPLTPPHSEEDRLAWLRLLRSRRVGISTFFRLLDEHGTAQAALAALPEIAKDAGVSEYRCCPEQVAQAELKAGRIAGARLIAFGSADYPAVLAEIPDPPPLLWVRGDISVLNRPAVAVAGARNASSLGMRMARKLSEGLAEAGFVVVSGLARGIDTAAHQAALSGGTIAVMAGGVDVPYPPENAVLMQEIQENGLLISEQPMGLQPIARHFPRRNRIISGLARALVIVEAAAKSGSLITARAALDQGRDVLAVPGHPFDERSSGCNMLIRDGAILVRNARDVAEALQGDAPQVGVQPQAPSALPRPAPKAQRSLRDTSKLHQIILDRLSPSPVAEDQLIRDIGMRAADVSAVLQTLEIEGRISRQPGGLLSAM